MALSKKAVAKIHAAIAKVFARAKTAFLGKDYGEDKVIKIHTLGSIYDEASLAGGAPPDSSAREVIQAVAESYLEAQEAAAKARVVKEVSAALQEAEHSGTKTDVPTVLGGALASTWGEVTAGVRRIVESEATTARNLGALEGIALVNEEAGIKDPVMFFVIVRDSRVCGECRKLHLWVDGVTPRLWYRSEISSGYHKHGDGTPCMSGLHPHCRCTPSTLMPGWGFTAGGMLTYVGPGHDEMAKQRA